jgi:ribosomal protein S27E
MDERELGLDGNAVAGMLSEVFVGEMTASQVSCASCGTVKAMAEERLYMFPLSPGAVLRCSNCDAPMMVFVHRSGVVRVGMPGVRWLEVSAPG